MIRVRKIYPLDGSPQSGLPTGPPLKVLRMFDKRPGDGSGAGVVVVLSDKTWEFAHNLVWMCTDSFCLKNKRFTETGPITLFQPSAPDGYQVCSCPASKLAGMIKG